MKKPSWLIALLSLLFGNLIGYLGALLLAWCKYEQPWYVSALAGFLAVMSLPLVVLVLGKLLLSKEEDDSSSGCIICLFWLMAAIMTPGPDMLLMLGPQPVCQSTLSDEVAQEACSFYCFPEVEVIPEATVSYKIRNAGFTIVALRAPGAPAPYIAWVEKKSIEEGGRCLWREKRWYSEDAARESSMASPNAIAGELIRDPAATLSYYRQWFWSIVLVIFLISFGFAYPAIAQRSKKQSQ